MMKRSLRSQLAREKIGFWWLGQKINLKDTLFLSILLFLPTQFGRHFWPDFSYVLGIRVDYLSPTLYFTDILITCLFLVLASQFKLKKFNSYLRHFEKKKTITLTIIILITLLIIGILLSKNPLSGWYGFVKSLEFVFFGFYTAFNIQRIKAKLIATVFSINILFQSFLSIFQFLNQSSIGGVFYFLGERSFNGQTPGIANTSLNGQLILRPYGTFSHPNVLAGFLLLTMTFLLYNLNYKIRDFGFWLKTLSLFLGAIAIFLTMSRTAILLWIFIMFLQGIKNFYKKKVFNFLLSAVLLIILASLTPLHLRFTEINFANESIVMRESLIKDSLVIIISHPIFGTGINNFLYNLPGTYLQPVHNIYLLIASQTGILGLGAFLWFIGKTYKRIRDQELKIRNRRPIIHNSKFIILSVVLILGFFDHYFLTLQQGQLLLSFVLGLAWVKNYI